MVTKKAAESAAEEIPVSAPVMGYKVVGVNAVFDVKPGGFIERDLTADEIKLLRGAGSIEYTEKKGA